MGDWLKCELTGEETHRREVGYPWVNADGQDIGEEIIKRGFALACRRFSERYVPFETPSAIQRLERAPYCLIKCRCPDDLHAAGDRCGSAHYRGISGSDHQHCLAVPLLRPSSAIWPTAGWFSPAMSVLSDDHIILLAPISRARSAGDAAPLARRSILAVFGAVDVGGDEQMFGGKQQAARAGKSD